MVVASRQRPRTTVKAQVKTKDFSHRAKAKAKELSHKGKTNAKDLNFGLKDQGLGQDWHHCIQV